jgi:hypothetical protein
MMAARQARILLVGKGTYHAKFVPRIYGDQHGESANLFELDWDLLVASPEVQ